MFRRLLCGSLAVAGGAGGFLSIYSHQATSFAKQTEVKSVLSGSDQYHKFKLIAKDDLTHDTRRYRFELPEKDSVLGWLPGQHVKVRAHLGEKLEHRAYSPTSDIDQQDFFDLVIKVKVSSVSWSSSPSFILSVGC